MVISKPNLTIHKSKDDTGNPFIYYTVDEGE